MGVGILRDGFMKKIGYIIIPVALIIILCIWGCMSYDKEKESTVKEDNSEAVKKDSSEEEIEYATSNDLSLEIKMKKKYNRTEDILISILLINKNQSAKRVGRHFDLDRGNCLDLYLEGPNNETLYILYGETGALPGEIILEHNEYLIMNISLKDQEITYRVKNPDGTYSGGEWDWNNTGIYTIWCKYSMVSPPIVSNKIKFEIT